MEPLSIEQVLADELKAFGASAQENRQAQDLNETATKQDAQSRLKRKDADTRSGVKEDADDIEQRKVFYRKLNKLNRAALSLSGGGIRSATFCLGVIQALAGYDVVTDALQPGEKPKLERTPDNSLLERFHFLSTVSGGGYIGSWLSAWRQRESYQSVWKKLTGRPDGPDVEPPELSWLRAYSNYLTPKIGLGSADTWSGIAIFVRNLLLNWLVIIPFVCLVLLGLKLLAATFVEIARSDQLWVPLTAGLLGAACLIKAQAFTTSHRPTRREPPNTDPSPRNVTQGVFLRQGLLWSVLSSMGIAIALVSHQGVSWIDGSSSNASIILPLAFVGAVIFSLGWLFGWPVRRSKQDFGFWVLSGLVYGMLIGSGAILFWLLHPYSTSADPHKLKLLLPMVFGVPWVLMSQLTAEMIFVGLVSYERESDSDREWLGRSTGWVSAAAIGWALTASLSIALGYYLQEVRPEFGKYFASLGGVTGIVTALVGSSSKTSAVTDAGSHGLTDQIRNAALALAGPLFVAILVVLLSVALDLLLLRASFVVAVEAAREPGQLVHIVLWLLLGAAVTGAIGIVASIYVNINRFSLHAVYRNRLVRCYLGASRQKRSPDRFTGFDEGDNLKAHTLWPPKAGNGRNTYGLFHVVNIALNVVDAKRLAWQERKAEPFTVSPTHCGSAYKGFRPSSEYADGLTLGTAMAISGAAVSPNMGYHSSPSITLLLALFNVRLGWWLGNPGKEGNQSFRSEGPSFAIKPLIGEAFGLTTDDSPYVYLSDGGHFENLGLYEMVRRRCRFIVLVDAGCDPDFTFEDLGNAVRKIYIDLGIRIQFNQLQAIKNRPTGESTEQQRLEIPYYTIGVIDYETADGAEENCENGYILYIKPAYHGTEGAGIVSYATAHPTFPHETTTDQWFTEAQFESYRSLGLEITNTILRSEIPLKNGLTLQELLSDLPSTAVQSPPETPGVDRD